MFGGPVGCDQVAQDYVNQQWGTLEDELGPDKPVPAECMPKVEALQAQRIGSDWDEIEKIKSYFQKQELPPGPVGDAQLGEPTTHLEAVPLSTDKQP